MQGKQGSIARQRKESMLKELVETALGELDNDLLRELEVVEVRCSRGFQDAKIFVEGSGLSENEKIEISKAFARARGVLQGGVLRASAWRSVPRLSLCFDSSLKYQRDLDSIFSEIEAKRRRDDN